MGSSNLYTIGYSGYAIPDFLQALHDHNIGILIDVRSKPFSAHFPDYNKETLSHRLRHENILYCSYAREFGARQTQPEFCPNGYPDFKLFAKSPQFQEGIRKVCSGVRWGYRIAFMCAEKDPITCHRSILVARGLAERGLQVVHLTPDGKELHSHLEQRLLDMYFPERAQISLLAESQDEIALLAEAYYLQNERIGFRLS